MLVSHADHFRWRDGGFGDLIPLLGDGMLTIDGDFHKQSRRIMLPAFHHERVKAAFGVMEEETERALSTWHDGLELDLYAWARELALRVAMRALFGFDADSSGTGARLRARARLLRARVLAAGAARPRHAVGGRCKPRAAAARPPDLRRDRRPPPHRAPRRGRAVAAARRPVQRPPRPRPRDDAAVRGPRHHHRDGRVPVLRARPPPGRRRRRRRRPAAARAGARRDAAPLPAGLDRPAPRRAGVRVRRPPRRRGRAVNYSSWASHRLPDVWEEPHAFRPERFAPEARKRIPKGAYVPFGGGSRICLGMRFGQAEIRAIASAVERALPRRVAARLPAPDPPDADARPSGLDFRCESGCRFRSEEVVPEGEGGPRWQAVSR